MESSVEGLQKMRNRGTTAFSNSNSEYRSKRVENRIWKRFLHTTYNSQEVEATQIPIVG